MTDSESSVGNPYVFGAVNSFTFTPVNSISSNFTLSQAFVGPNVAGLLATIGYTDNPSILNASFIWNGANHTVVSGGGAAVFFLTLNSNDAGVAIGAYNSSDHSFLPHDLESHAVGFLLVPTAPTPDGGSAVALLGIALAGVGGVRRMFRARKT